MAKKIIRMKEKGACNCNKMCGCGGAGYCLGFIGSAIYYISTAQGFWQGVLGFLKAIVWPVFLVFGAMKSLGL